MVNSINLKNSVIMNILQMPMWLKVMIGGIPIIFVIVYVAMLNSNGNHNRKLFYSEELSVMVISSNKYHGRETEFRLSNGLKIYFGLSVDSTIMIGDSILKEPNTYNYNVYRKNMNGEYKYWTTYNFNATL